jgi:acyl carrier protein
VAVPARAAGRLPPGAARAPARQLACPDHTKIAPEGVHEMDDEVRQFVISALGAMNYDVSDVTGNTDLGPAGLDLESLAVAELAVQVEDKFGVKFTDEDTEQLALMTLDEFAGEVGSRIAVTAGGKAE